jgi:hypothetical protein
LFSAVSEACRPAAHNTTVDGDELFDHNTPGIAASKIAQMSNSRPRQPAREKTNTTCKTNAREQNANPPTSQDEE